jgi:hypothetical protein
MISEWKNLSKSQWIPQWSQTFKNKFANAKKSTMVYITEDDSSNKTLET